uniref:Lipoprotein n=1 Tax=Neovison vison TaxID=452646 RepID=A0A8C7C421_NEOVI
MKLLRVLLLITLPLSCFVGSGCSSLDEVINKAIDLQVSIGEYQNILKPFSNGPETDESDKTLSSVAEMMVITLSLICFQASEQGQAGSKFVTHYVITIVTHGLYYVSEFNCGCMRIL